MQLFLPVGPPLSADSKDAGAWGRPPVTWPRPPPRRRIGHGPLTDSDRDRHCQSANGTQKPLLRNLAS